jgi:predicted glycosyltransferase
LNILFNIGHPAQVHLFKNLIWELSSRGHECKVTTIAKDVSLHLLDAYGFEYDIVGRERPTLVTKAIELIRVESRLYRIARSFRPDILIGGVGNCYVAHIGNLIRKPSIVFDDTEHAKIDHLLMDPFASVICTPSCYRGDIGSKQVRYQGYHELAYLHPHFFTPNPAVLRELDLAEGDTFIIVRLISWQASHDVGQHGIRDKVGLVRSLEQYGRVLITSEGPLPPELEQNRTRLSPEKMHDLLYYATLYIGEGATMASESAILGTHAIYVSTLRLGYTDEEEEKYGLVYGLSNPDEMETGVLNKAVELLKRKDLHVRGKLKQQNLLEDKIDVTAFMIWFIENYPGSVKQMKVEPGIQEQFRTV